ncbi:ribosome maturation factor RimM [Lewinella sp. IMCC34191]|uniref:ribosome maturation factor RimM n=1 Tax=Lewinella sp. IMCC34191 TaxID=2259172 RepID=UPI000E225175|nr:ribosome maturation factor RimM [Lewinella sp. IMCC34191]
MELVEIGRTGRPHGIRGDLALHVVEAYEEDLLKSNAILIGNPPIPYFVRSFRSGGKLTVSLETFNTREAVALLTAKPLFLPADQVSVDAEEEGTPWDYIIGYTIMAEGYPPLGPIEDVMDLPEHYLAELTYKEKTVFVPLHEDLVLKVRETDTVLEMQLPEGLLELGA